MKPVWIKVFKKTWNNDITFKLLSDEGKIKFFMFMVKDKFPLISDDDMKAFLKEHNIPGKALTNLIRIGEIIVIRDNYYKLVE